MSHSITLDDRLEAFITEQIAQGRYANPGEVVAAALRLLEEQDRLRREKIAAIRLAIEESRRDGRLLSEEEVFGPLEARLQVMTGNAEQQERG